MANLSVYVAPAVVSLFVQIQSIPFYREEDGYHFAKHLLSLEDGENDIQTFLEDPGKKEAHFPSKMVCMEFAKLLKALLADLENLVIPEEDMSAWMMFQKKQGTIQQYHILLANFLDSIVCLMVSKKVVTGEKADVMETDALDVKNPLAIQYTDTVIYEDKQAVWEQQMQIKKCHSKKMVLNRNNPFADISIEQQQFPYGSVMGEFEVLGLTTSHTVTRVAKSAETSYLALQPGFKIRKTKKVRTGSSGQNVLFDDTISAELAQTDDHMYVYLN